MLASAKYSVGVALPSPKYHVGAMLPLLLELMLVIGAIGLVQLTFWLALVTTAGKGQRSSPNNRKSSQEWQSQQIQPNIREITKIPRAPSQTLQASVSRLKVKGHESEPEWVLRNKMAAGFCMRECLEQGGSGFLDLSQCG